ncbi:transposase [Flammeovirga sp. MY04]|uniref:integrase core domain-containing protein n=1 Tax=Flammeovirga sp. MY04 TaxID=1191459 RepID=UPI0013053A81|nr:integrase core domain-containing protein [Flammeovirga sp. MY04]ANQ51527.2 transposase [Flammeovirga sp. MY04]
MKSLIEWGVQNCNMPTYLTQSNVLCVSLIETFKREYVFESCLENPESVIDHIQEWVDEYNGYAPHSALMMMNPNEYY